MLPKDTLIFFSGWELNPWRFNLGMTMTKLLATVLKKIRNLMSIQFHFFKEIVLTLFSTQI